MRIEHFLIGGHGIAAVLALVAVTVWPRPGEPALLVPFAGTGLAAVSGWASREGAVLLELDTARGRVIARLPDNRSPLTALGAGIFPLAARARTCQARRTP